MHTKRTCIHAYLQHRHSRTTIGQHCFAAECRRGKEILKREKMQFVTLLRWTRNCRMHTHYWRKLVSTTISIIILLILLLLLLLVLLHLLPHYCHYYYYNYCWSTTHCFSESTYARTRRRVDGSSSKDDMWRRSCVCRVTNSCGVCKLCMRIRMYHGCCVYRIHTE